MVLTEQQMPWEQLSRAEADPLYNAVVCCSFAELEQAWIIPPHMVTKKSMLQQSQLAELLHVLRHHSLDSRAALAAAWQKDPVLLKRQLLACLKKGQQGKLLQLWPSALSQACQSLDQSAS